MEPRSGERLRIPGARDRREVLLGPIPRGGCSRRQVRAGARASGRPRAFRVQAWRVRKDGTRFMANVVLTPLRDDSGVNIGFGSVARDVSERRRAEAEHRDTEERLLLMVSAVKDYAILMLDPD